MSASSPAPKSPSSPENGISRQSRTSTTTFPSNPHNISEERMLRFYSDACLKSCLKDPALCPYVVFHTVLKVTEITSLKAINSLVFVIRKCGFSMKY